MRQQSIWSGAARFRKRIFCNLENPGGEHGQKILFSQQDSIVDSKGPMEAADGTYSNMTKVTMGA
jgi:hypothetical protein